MLQETKLTVEECRKHLGRDAEELSDTQVQQLRDALYTLSENVLDSLFMNLTVDSDHE